MDQNLDLRKVSIEKKVKLGLAATSILLIAPFTFFILQGILGALALGAAAVVGFVSIQLAPVFALKVANWRMKLITSEAEKNPIETMKNLFIEKSKDVQESDRRIVEFDGKIGDYHDKMISFKRRYPEEAQRYEDIETKMRTGLQNMKRKQVVAKQALSELKANIDKAESIYAMALAAADVTSLSKDIEKQVFQDIKQQVAFDAVTHKLNTAVSALSLEVENSDDYKSSLSTPNLDKVLLQSSNKEATQ